MANTPNSQLVKLALGVVSIAALAGITGRMSTASATEAEISTSDSTTAESETKSKKKSESIIILGREFDKHDLKFWDDDECASPALRIPPSRTTLHPSGPRPSAPSQGFRAMNTTVTVDGTDRDLRPWFRRVESYLSRFDPGSPLSQLNRMSQRWVVVPRLLYRAIRAALKAAAATDGAFDPTMLSAMEAAGYSQSFDLGPTPARPAVPAGRWREVKLEPTISAIWLPQGVRLDLGGIGKGLAVDGAMTKLRRVPRLVVNAGRDLAIRTALGESPVLVDVEDPFDPSRTLATFGLYQGAVTTSSTVGRTWGPGLHHIIDPTTGRPTKTDVAAATVTAPTAAQAEILANACVVLGRQRGLALLARYHSQW